MPSLKAEIRRYQDHMVLSGKGVILLGIWGLFKVLFLQLLLDHGLDRIIANQDLIGIDINLAKIIFLITFSFLCLIILALHFYIGRSAIKYSKGQKSNNIFITFTAIYGIFNMSSLTYYFTEHPEDTITDTSVAAFLLDITLIYILFDIIYSYFKIRKLNSRLKEQSDTHVDEQKVEQV